MEIIHLILGKANPDRMNGVNKVVFQLATRQARAGKNVSVWGITHSLAHDYGEREFVTRLFPASRNPFRMDPLLKDALLEKKGQAVVHLHGGWLPAYYSISAFLARNAIPFVITPHGAYNSLARRRSAGIKKVYFRFFEKRLLDRAARIHAIGESEVEGLMEIYPTEKSFLLPYGFEAPHAGAADRTDRPEFIVGFVGRLDIFTKGLDLALEAFAEFRKEMPASQLWIVGDGPERETLRSMAVSLGLEKDVILWGSKFGKDKEALMQQMDVFIHPSRNEGLPASVLEAAGMKIPCIVSIATNMGGYVDRYRAGIAIQNGSAHALAGALQEMAGRRIDGTLAQTGDGAGRMVAEAFDWNRIVKEFDTLYQLA